MPSLQRVDERFGSLFTVIQGGGGQFTGMLSEPPQGEVPSFQFNLPRRLLRVEAKLPITEGMVIRTPDGTAFMVGHHGAAESYQGALFRNFRLFEATGQFSWQRRGKEIDPATRLPRDTGLQDLPAIYGVYEPSPEMFDRQMRTSFEAGRFITNSDVKINDVVDGRKVSRVDMQLGLRLCTLG
jgi:hypothetical protein